MRRQIDDSMVAPEQPQRTASNTGIPPFDAVALVASAGGLEAISAVLRELPASFPAAVFVLQHLGGQSVTLADILARRTKLPVEWAEDGMPVVPGLVQVCPPRRRLEVLPDGTCSLSPNDRGALDRPLDFFLESLADSFGARALAVVLTGMGKDAAAGARAIKLAGGAVLVQSEETAEQPSMPRAAIETGAVDLVLPLHEIGPVLAGVMASGRLPLPYTEVEAVEALFAGPGEVPRLLRAVDWSRTPLGPVKAWPAHLKTAIRVVLESPMPMIVLWGPDNIQLYNDHYRILMGNKHPAGLGQPNRECWPEVWHLNEPVFKRVLEGEPVALADAHFPITRHGAMEDAWFNLYYTPVRGEQGNADGILATILETTGQVLANRRLRTLHDMTNAAAGAVTLRAAIQQATDSLRENEQDVPFAVSYLLDDTALGRAQLVTAVRVEPGGPMAPRALDLRGGNPAWPLARVVDEKTPVLLQDISSRFRGFSPGPGDEAPTAALLLPLSSSSHRRPVGVLIVGINPRLELDEPYRHFLDLIAAEVSAAMAEAEIRQKEREQIERLAEIDRTKTEFFSNVSHEFRTPLTLMLGPLEELLLQRDELPGELAAEIDVATRNARRLLTLVNTLLDFSRAEAGRLHAKFEPVDLASLTADIAGVFRSAVDRAGLHLQVNCAPLPEQVWVDRDMWEKIVSNLLSNALKFTFEGEIAVEMRALPQHAELVVRDTGVGIPDTDLPHLFERFFRARGSRARTGEGSGIGLSLVHELVRLHHGRIRVQSREGEGTAFTVWLPLGARLPSSGVLPESDDSVETRGFATALAEAAVRWVAVREETPQESEDIVDLTGADGIYPRVQRAHGARVLVVDDNADMRDYVRRLLSPLWQVETASDGVEALRKIREVRPALILADVMMPNLDGFELLRKVREEGDLRSTPVILLTARAGEEAAVEGLLAGADDYLAKPFSSRELIARVGAQLETARLRRENEQRFGAFVTATSDIVYRVSPDWSEMRQLHGKGFLADTQSPSGTWVEEYIIPEDRSRVKSVIDEAIRTRGNFELEHRVRRADGSMGWVFSRAVPLLDASGEVVEWFGAATDITERKRAEELLRQSHHVLDSALRIAHMAAWEWDSEHDRTTATETMSQVFGLSPGETFDSSAHGFKLVHPDDRERYGALVEHARRQGTGWHAEFRVIRPRDGEVAWLEEHAQSIHDPETGRVRTTGLVWDITDRKRAEEVLRRSEEKYRLQSEASDARARAG